MTLRPRPLSPHLQIYRPQLTSVLSILHRVTGVALAVALLALSWWLIAAATGPEAFAVVEVAVRSWVGRATLLCCTFCISYHLCNGIRHLFWDGGIGLDLRVAYSSGWTAVAASVALTAVIWISSFAAKGAAP